MLTSNLAQSWPSKVPNYPSHSTTESSGRRVQKVQIQYMMQIATSWLQYIQDQLEMRKVALHDALDESPINYKFLFPEKWID